MNRHARSLRLSVACLLLMLPTTATAATLPSGSTDQESSSADGARSDGTADPAGAEGTVDDARLLLLLDSSYSMAEDDADGTPKIEAARGALDEVVDGLDPGQQVGLRVFGGEVARDQPTEAKCTDSRLVVPVSAGSGADLHAAVQDYEPTGETPIGYALQQAAEDLGPDGNRTVLLVSDGIATCDPDPCEVAEELSADGLDLVVHTVGLGVDDETRGQLRCIADAAGGTYYDADDTDTLTTALTRISTRAFRPFEFDGIPVEGTYDQQSAPVLAEGRHLDTFPDPEAGGEKWYRIQRSVPGSTIHVGATMRPDGDVSTGTFNLRLGTETVNVCDSRNALVWTSGRNNGFGSASAAAFTHEQQPDCGTAEEVLVRVSPVLQADLLAGQTVELRVVEEPPVEDADDLPEPDTAVSFDGPELDEPVETLIGGSSFAGAVPIEPGLTYAADILPGQVLVYRIPVGWGQRLEAAAEFPEADGPLAEHMKGTTHPADLALFGPDRGDVTEPHDTVGTQGRVLTSWNETSRATATTAEVRYWNRLEGVTGGAADRAGDYYVTVGLTSSEEDDPVPQPFTFTTQLVGEPHGEPTYVDSADDDAARTTAGTGADAEEQTDGSGTGTDDPAAAADEGAATGAAPAQSPDDQDGADWLPWALGVGGVLAAGAGVVLLRTRRGPTA